MKVEKWFGAAVIAAALASSSGPAGAGQNGAPAGAVAAAHRDAPTISHALKPSKVYEGAGFVSSGVALRNRGSGIIGISGVTGPVKAGWLYWAVITSGKPTAANTSVTLGSFYPAVGATVTLTGSIVGSGESPGWGPSAAVVSVFRAAVPANLFAKGHGNGLFQVTLKKGASGLTNGADPFAAGNVVLPLMEGASLVVVGKGASTVAIYDSGLAGQTFGASLGLAYTLILPINASGSSSVLFDEIGADGQMFFNDAPNTGFSTKTTAINNSAIAGPSAPDVIPDWDGLSGLPLPQLWDDTAHDVTTAAGKGGKSMNISITGGTSGGFTDALVPVANIVAIAQAD